jgi:hypothetical protein
MFQNRFLSLSLSLSLSLCSVCASPLFNFSQSLELIHIFNEMIIISDYYVSVFIILTFICLCSLFKILQFFFHSWKILDLVHVKRL